MNKSLITLVKGCSNCTIRKSSSLHLQSVKKIDREIPVTDEKIDEIVYVLYGVTEEEIGII